MGKGKIFYFAPQVIYFAEDYKKKKHFKDPNPIDFRIKFKEEKLLYIIFNVTPFPTTNYRRGLPLTPPPLLLRYAPAPKYGSISSLRIVSQVYPSLSTRSIYSSIHLSSLMCIYSNYYLVLYNIQCVQIYLNVKSFRTKESTSSPSPKKFGLFQSASSKEAAKETANNASNTMTLSRVGQRYF